MEGNGKKMDYLEKIGAKRRTGCCSDGKQEGGGSIITYKAGKRTGFLVMTRGLKTVVDANSVSHCRVISLCILILGITNH